jgi:MYXO-CTERM domain-containing protein
VRAIQAWVVAAGVLAPAAAHAWTIGHHLEAVGFHEEMTAAALRAVRTRFATAAAQAPTRDEAALFADVQFKPPADLLDDLGAMSLLLGVRDNDLKGKNPADSLDLVQIHGGPDNQHEHCLRSAENDGAQGDEDALAACRAFVRQRATQALEGLDGQGAVDLTNRIEMPVYTSIAGYISPRLPLFHVRMGQALHALEDGFSHTFRTADGMRVIAVENFLEVVEDRYEARRDGPEHAGPLDHCESQDPLVVRNHALAARAVTELLEAALDPGLGREEKIAAIAAVTARYLTYEPGCTFDNQLCGAPEPSVQGQGCGCQAGGGRPRTPDLQAFVVVALLAAGLRARRLRLAMASLAIVGALAVPARARQGEKTDAQSARAGVEPGRDHPIQTDAEALRVRNDKRLGSRWGGNFQTGASYARPAFTFSTGLRFRISERWTTGADVAWNPWVTLAPMQIKAGAFNAYGTLIARFPMQNDRTNIRSSLHLGASTLLFDVYGAPKYSVGPYVAISPLGLDIDIGNAWRIVLDPAEIAVAMPVAGQIPLYYEQLRFTVGVQWGG